MEYCWQILPMMKDSLLINGKHFINFWAEGMSVANYLQNQLLTRQVDKMVIVPEEAQTGTKQNVEHICIFESKVSTHILIERHSKSDIQMTWNGIFIVYTDTTKHVKMWPIHTHQILIASEPILNKSSKRTQLLINFLMPPSENLLREPAEKP